MQPRILAFAGSTRTDSFNKKLVRAAARGAEAAGALVTVIDLRDYPLPLYDGDLEAKDGLPENAMKLKKLLLEHQGLLISTPEYNSSYSAVLKNMIDWVSRPVPGEAPLAVFDGKVVAIMAASPGALGGMRALVSLRMLLGNLRMLVLPQQLAVGKAGEVFDAAGTVKDEKQRAGIEQLGAEVARMCGKLVE